MPQHTATPSPHRFIGTGRRALSPSREKPGSALRKQVKQPLEGADSPSQPVSQAAQFAPTPRFYFGQPKYGSQITRQQSPPRPAVVEALRASHRPVEDVEEASDADFDDEMLDNEPTDAVPSIEREMLHETTTSKWTNDLTLSPKRRKIGEEEPLQLPLGSTFKRPESPASHFTRQTPRFTPQQTQSTQPFNPTDLNSARLTFIRPSAPPQESIEPLPDVFSPHRRGQKFIPGGLAATVQQWVLETGQAAVQTRKGQAYLRGDDFVMRAKIEGEVQGVGPYTANGRSPDGDSMHLLLAGSGNEKESRSKRLESGNVIGIRAPTWELHICEESCTVCVDWRVIS